MTKLAPRQGIFAIILLASFIIHVLILIINTEIRQTNHSHDKGEKIVAQLGKESLASIINQDRISLSVLLNRYQVDDDIDSLIITDSNNRILASIGNNDSLSQMMIEQNVSQNNQTIGKVIVYMKDIAKSDIITNQLFFILASLVLHILIWLCYGYTSRPTKEQLLLVQQKLQQSLLKNQQLNQRDQADDNRSRSSNSGEMPNANISKSIDDYLFKQRKPTANAESVLTQENEPTTSKETPTTEPEQTEPVAQTVINDVVKTQVTIHFYDENGLLNHIAPELSEPYYQFCEELLQKTIFHLFLMDEYYQSDVLKPYTQGVTIERMDSFGADGVVFNLIGNDDKLAMAGVLVAKLFIILNQVMYEKHRELGRFALPTQVGIGKSDQQVEIAQLMTNHGQEDGILMLLPEEMISTLHGNVQLKNLRTASTLAEREMLYYNGLSAGLMEALIAERGRILQHTK